MKGSLIAIEGLDGSGKSTVATRLATELMECGRSVLLTREPGGTRVGEQVRHLLLGDDASHVTAETEALLFAASRAQLVSEVIQPALEGGAIVIVDRFVDSSLAYQGGGRGLDFNALVALQRFATGGLRPDLRILLDIPSEVALRRRRSAATNRLDGEDNAFYDRVRETYLRLAAEDPAGWCIVAAGAEPETVWQEVWGNVMDHFKADGAAEPSRLRPLAMPS